ncbi:hypothetical protein AgCh_031258 [Apium graveolens]
MSACSKIRHIVRLRIMLKRWRQKAASRIPSDVPSGHVAVTVGPSCRRFVVPAKYLNHPVFRELLVRAEEEYGFNNTGPLVIPCDEWVFEEIIKCLSWSHSKNQTRDFNFNMVIFGNVEFHFDSSELARLPCDEIGVDESILKNGPFIPMKRIEESTDGDMVIPDYYDPKDPSKYTDIEK